MSSAAGPLTAIVIAQNSERTIGDCVRALAFCDRVIVGENGSADRTAEAARQAGAEVRSVVWQGYGATKNALLADVAAGWILSVDADEVVTPELAGEIRQTLATVPRAAGFQLSRRNFFLGREIRHAGWSPDWQLRLFRAGAGRFEERPVHEALRVDGEIGRLRGRLDHYSYPDLESYFDRLNRYTSLAAEDRRRRGRRFSPARLLCDPPWTFVNMYLLRGGWRDGFPGFLLCSLSALNTLVKHAKQWEGRGTGDPGAEV